MCITVVKNMDRFLVMQSFDLIGYSFDFLSTRKNRCHRHLHVSYWIEFALINNGDIWNLLWQNYYILFSMDFFGCCWSNVNLRCLLCCCKKSLLYILTSDYLIICYSLSRWMVVYAFHVCLQCIKVDDQVYTPLGM